MAVDTHEADARREKAAALKLAREGRKAFAVALGPIRPLPLLTWGKSKSKVRLDDGFHSADERRRKVRTGICQRLSKRECEETPAPFRDALLAMARSVGRSQVSG